MDLSDDERASSPSPSTRPAAILSGSLRVGAPSSAKATAMPPSAGKEDAHATGVSEAARMKAELEAQMARIAQQLRALDEPTDAAQAAHASDEPMKDAAASAQKEASAASAPATPVKQSPALASDGASTSQSPATVVDLTDESPTPASASAPVSTAAATVAAAAAASASVSSLSTPSAPCTPTSGKKRKAPEGSDAPNSATAAEAEPASASNADSDAATAAAAPTSDSLSATSTPAAKKAKSSSSSKKPSSSGPKETAEQKAARKEAERLAKEAEKAAAKAAKEAERLKAKEAARLEAERKRAEKEAEKAAAKEAQKREAEEKRAEKAREAEAKRAEVEGKKQEREAKKEARAAEQRQKEEALQAKKKAEEKSKSILSSFFKKAPSSPKQAAAFQNNAEVASAKEAVPVAVDSAASDSAAAAASDTPIAAVAPAAGDKPQPAALDKEKDRSSRNTALFLPFEPPSHCVWTRTRGPPEPERARRAQALMDLLQRLASGAEALTAAEQEAESLQPLIQPRKREMRDRSTTGRRKKLLQFHDNYRPAWFGRMKRSLREPTTPAAPLAAAAGSAAMSDSSSAVSAASSRFLAAPRARRPCARWSVSADVLNYDVDSDDEWGEEPDDAEELDSDADDLDSDSEAGSDSEADRGDGLKEDGWLVPEALDPLAQHTADPVSRKGGKGGSKQSSSSAVAVAPPCIVGPVLDLDAQVAAYLAAKAAAAAGDLTVPEVKLSDDARELMQYKKRYLVALPIDFDPSYSWRIPAAEVAAAIPPSLTTPKSDSAPLAAADDKCALSAVKDEPEADSSAPTAVKQETDADTTMIPCDAQPSNSDGEFKTELASPTADTASAAPMELITVE